jgi:hypothetical protein
VTVGAVRDLPDRAGPPRRRAAAGRPGRAAAAAADPAWLAAARRPTPSDVARALRLPVDIALVAAVTWLGGALLVGTVGAVVSPFPLVGLRISLAALLGGVVAAGVSYLLALRIGRHVTARALQAHPPTSALGLGVRPLLLLTWGLTSGVPCSVWSCCSSTRATPRGPARPRSSSSRSSPWSSDCSPPC